LASLLNDINDYKASFNKKASQEKKRLFAQAIKELEESGVAQGLHVGDPVPDFTLPDVTGKSISLSEVLAKGPVILTFYRGGWCPYCNLELRAYQRVLPEIKESGAQLIAISPQTPDASLSTKEKDELEFLVLSDEGGKVAQQFDVVFKMQDYLIDLYKQSGMDIPAYNGDETWDLPKPATFVIDQQRNIIFTHVDSDYRNRTEPSEVIKIVKSL